MKPAYTNNKERAKVLHQLFPSEMRQYISFMQKEAARILNNPAVLKKEFPAELVTAAFWKELAKIVSEFFNKNGDRVAADSELFSSFFFQGYEIQFASYCLQRYIQSKQCKNRLFKDTARLLLFDRE